MNLFLLVSTLLTVKTLATDAPTSSPTESPTAFNCNLCQNGGTCNSNNTHCHCEYPYYGEFCETLGDCACSVVV